MIDSADKQFDKHSSTASFWLSLVFMAPSPLRLPASSPARFVALRCHNNFFFRL
jgi:hypothetical protein